MSSWYRCSLLIDFHRTLARALHLYQELQAAEEAAASFRRMQSSAFYIKASELGADILKDKKKTVEHTLHAAKSRFREAVSRLDHLPSGPLNPDVSETLGEANMLNAFVKEASSWLADVRPTIENIRSTPHSDDASSTAVDSHSGTPVPSPIEHDRTQILTRLDKMQERLESLESYHQHLKDTQLDAVEEAVRDIKQRAPTTPATTVTLSDAQAQRLQEHIEVQRRTMEGLNIDMVQLKTDVLQLLHRHKDFEHQAQALRVENAELRAQQTKVRLLVSFFLLSSTNLLSRRWRKPMRPWSNRRVT